MKIAAQSEPVLGRSVVKKPVVVGVALALCVTGAWLLFFKDPTFGDPFASGTRDTFEEIGMPVVSIEDVPYVEGINGIIRGIVVEVDPALCPAAGFECVKAIMNSQPWAIDLRTSNENELVFDVQDGGKTCDGFGRQVEERDRDPATQQLISEFPDDITQVWVFAFTCPITDEF